MDREDPPTERSTNNLRVTPPNETRRNHTALRTNGRLTSSRMVLSDRELGCPSHPREIIYRSIHKNDPTARKENLSHHSRPISILAESNYGEASYILIDEYSVQTVTEGSESSQVTADDLEYQLWIRTFRQNAIPPMTEAPIEAISSGARLMRITSHPRSLRSRVATVAQGIMEVLTNQKFCITI